MISIIKNGKVVRHVDCDVEDADIQCLEGETWVNGELPFDVQEAKETLQIKLDRIAYSFKQQVAALTEYSGETEQPTWIKQEQEARAWLLDSSTSTPLVDAMVQARGCTKEYLVGKIIEKADLYTAEVGRLLGEKQRKEKELLGEYK